MADEAPPTNTADEYRSESVPEVLAQMTGRDASNFDASGAYPQPDLDDLESVPEDER